jgi:hypothetical protein
LDIGRAKERFAQHFKQGFDDPEYVRRERGASPKLERKFDALYRRRPKG